MDFDRDTVRLMRGQLVSKEMIRKKRLLGYEPRARFHMVDTLGVLGG